MASGEATEGPRPLRPSPISKERGARQPAQTRADLSGGRLRLWVRLRMPARRRCWPYRKYDARGLADLRG
eukprot:1404868-Pleurochrysis_carterae.AAC.1